MPKLLFVRAPADQAEERKIRKLAGSRHAPADWIRRAKIIQLSWTRHRVPRIAAELGCSEKTVRCWIERFNADGLDGFADRPGGGRKRRITELERSVIVGMVRRPPPGRLVRHGDGELRADDETEPGVWTLDTLTDIARNQGIDIHRSQVRRILLAEGVRWVHTRSWTKSEDPDFAPKGRGSWSCTRTRRRTPPSSAVTNSGR